MTTQKKAVVAMSGGVDSSVAAALLVQQGYDVTGMMLRLWSETGREADNRCCTPDAMAQARRVSAILGIPFYVIDAQEVFRKTVVEYFLDGYSSGITPNPCLVCNRQIRWDFLLKHALAFGANYMATGHYLRISQDAADGFQILRAIDRKKDQSYVLHILGQDQLAHALFPIGAYQKAEIRQIARELGLPVAERPDSQDLCFLSHDNYRNFLSRNAPEALISGSIETLSGEVLGQHEGLALYTVGQRKGLGISSAQPLYVLEKNLERNTLTVGPASQLGQNELRAAPVNWVSGSAPTAPFLADVKIRYQSTDAAGLVTPVGSDQVHIHFENPLRDITPGQAAVIYQNDICLGGGIIQQSAAATEK